MISMIVFTVGSLPILWWSRRSLLHPSSHGFSRFFAFEAIFALVVLNAPYWFVRPAGVQQIGSWFLLTISIVLVVWGVVLLRRIGKSRPITGDAPEFGWESTAHLVTTGVFRYIRHPMYSSLLFLAWGALLKSVSVATLSLAGMATLALVFTAKAEEVENLAHFGEAYRTYMKNTSRFVPFLF